MQNDRHALVLFSGGQDSAINNGIVIIMSWYCPKIFTGILCSGCGMCAWPNGKQQNKIN
jgi:hypothetical protein